MKYETREMNDAELHQADLDAVTGGGAAALAARNAAFRWLYAYEDRRLQYGEAAYLKALAQ